MSKNQIIKNTKNFDIKKSADYVKAQYVGLKRKTIEIVKHLHWAKEFYNNPGFRADLVPNGTRLKTFDDYINYIGIAKRTIYNWLERYEPKKQKLLTVDEFKEEKKVARILQKDRILKYKKTGNKPKGWTRADDYQFKKHYDDEKRTERVDDFFQEKANNKAAKKIQDKILDDAVKKAVDIESKKEEMFKNFETDGSLSGVFNVINDYLLRLDNDSRRIEACQNVIKFCRNKAVDYQK